MENLRLTPEDYRQLGTQPVEGLPGLTYRSPQVVADAQLAKVEPLLQAARALAEAAEYAVSMLSGDDGCDACLPLTDGSHREGCPVGKLAAALAAWQQVQGQE